ncbi:MAG: fatty acid hydroxylase family protein, partial [Pseudomonadota bacterium]|nr:fatty acid hydroxylase family protein [Pseudomonadota bacterium]
MTFIAEHFGTGPEVFLGFFLVLYASSLIVLFTTGLTMTVMNRRHPDRKIQKRQPTHDALRDIKSS